VATGVEIRVLGPLEVVVDGCPVHVPDGKPRALLGALIARTGQLVSFDRLADLLWNGRPPERVAAALQTCVWRLRRSLGVELISTHPNGYRLNDATVTVDLLIFRTLLAKAAVARINPAGRELAHLTDALTLWRGAAFVDISAPALLDEILPPLTEERLAAYERRIDLELDAGRTDQAITQIRELIGENPLRESLWSRLLKALAQAGRQAEALAAFHDFRGKLVDQLGVEPGRQLSSAYLRLLTPLPRLSAGIPTSPARDRNFQRSYRNQRPYA
jgi:DNA-binding SARP family transcriptional activator